MNFEETKRHLDKPTQIFTCELVQRGENWVVLKYVSDRSWQISDVVLPAGTCTLAYYQIGADCVVWKMIAPDGQLLGHLFHICSDLAIESQRVEYLDLLLDVWVDLNGKATLLDIEDLAMCLENGILLDKQARNIRDIANKVFDGWQEWVLAFEKCLDTPTR